MIKEIPIGGLVAIGIDANDKYILLVTHNGRGLFDIETGERISRDYTVLYPEQSEIKGIGVLTNQIIEVDEYDFENPLIVFSKKRQFKIIAESDTLQIFKLL